MRQTVLVKQGIERDLAQKIVKEVKGAKLKVQVAIQGDELRVTGKKRDDLQAAIAQIKGLKIDAAAAISEYAGLTAVRTTERQRHDGQHGCGHQHIDRARRRLAEAPDA